MKRSRGHPGRSVIRPLKVATMEGTYDNGRDDIAPAYLSVRELPVRCRKVI